MQERVLCTSNRPLPRRRVAHQLETDEWVRLSITMAVLYHLCLVQRCSAEFDHAHIRLRRPSPWPPHTSKLMVLGEMGYVGFFIEAGKINSLCGK